MESEGVAGNRQPAGKASIFSKVSWQESEKDWHKVLSASRSPCGGAFGQFTDDVVASNSIDALLIPSDFPFRSALTATSFADLFFSLL
jgi:hypothetical protein